MSKKTNQNEWRTLWQEKPSRTHLKHPSLFSILCRPNVGLAAGFHYSSCISDVTCKQCKSLIKKLKIK